MMKKTIRFFIFLLVTAVPLKVKSQYTLEIEIVNLRNNKGNILLELLDENDKRISGKQGGIVNNKCSITISNLKKAKYAIRYFHDENTNDQLDTNWLGLPAEGFGFSNDAYGSFGPKDFKEWLFILSTDMRISLKPKY